MCLMNIHGLNCGNCLAQTWTKASSSRFPWNGYIWNSPKTEPLLTLHTPTSPKLIVPKYNDSTHSVRSMKHVVFLFNDSHSLIWQMIVTIQKWFRIINLSILDRSIPCSYSTIVGELCIITLMIWRIWDQTSGNHQVYCISYYYDITTKPRIK